MSDLLKSVSGGIARFALAWVLPVAVAVGVYWAACIPALADDGLLPWLTGRTGSGRDDITALGVAAFVAFVVAVLLAYSSQLLYRVLEGYHLPRWLNRRWTAKQLRRFDRVAAMVEAGEKHGAVRSSKEHGLALERRGLYPPERDRVMPTRLGNALKALESYGVDRFGLDSQQFWYELIGTAEPAVAQEQDDARAQVDVFVAAVAVFGLLAAGALVTGIAVTDRSGPLAVAAGAAAFVPIAYSQAVRNMKEWANSVRALVNLGRWPMADAFGLELPWRLDDERTMWSSVSGVLHYGDASARPWLDVFRRGTPWEPVPDGLRWKVGRGPGESESSRSD